MPEQFLIIDSAERRQEAAHAIMCLTGEKIHSVTIKPYRARRSTAQNRLLWSWMGLIADHMGIKQSNKEEMEALFDSVKRHTIGSYEVTDPITGELRNHARSSSQLNTLEFTDFLIAIEEKAEDLLGEGGKFPQPHEYELVMGNKKLCN